MAKIRVLVVDDSVVMRRMLSLCLADDPDIDVVGTACDGKVGLAKIDHLAPDIVTLDLDMPVMDGLQTLRALRQTHPKLPVIMFSTLTERGTAATLDALALGASDYAAKPGGLRDGEEAMQRVRAELVPKIKRLCRSNAHTHPPTPMHATTRPAMSQRSLPPSAAGRPGSVEAVAIGVSTGGPAALAELLPKLSAHFPVPVLIVQHMPPMFTNLLAQRISAFSRFRAREGETGAVLHAGDLWIAPGGFHMEVERTAADVRLRIHDGAMENSCRPAVDVLFRSVAKVFGANTLAVVLTGMGQDGLQGARAIRENGGQIFVQDEMSSVVWGMPGAVFQAGLADKVLSLDALAEAINLRVQAGLPRRHHAQPQCQPSFLPQV